MLLGRGEPAVERQDLGATQAQPGQRIAGVADLTLPGAEHEDVLRPAFGAGRMGPQLFNRFTDATDLIDLDVGGRAVLGRRTGPGQRPVGGLHGIGPAGDFDDRRWRAIRCGEVLGEPVHIDGG